jgi:hypothetical protein
MAEPFQPNVSLNTAIFNACDALCILTGSERPVLGVDPIWQIQKKGCAAVVNLNLFGGIYVSPGPITASGLSMTQNRILGRTDAGVGAIQELGVGTGLLLSGGGISNAGILDVTVVAPLSSTAGQQPEISIPVATGSADGYLSSADWTTFNNKQPAGNYITALTGDATAAGPGSVALTLATVNADVGSFGSATQVPVFTVDGKGRITAVANAPITLPSGSAPASSSAAGIAGQMAYDDEYLYVATALNTWRRAPISDWV